MIFSNKNKGFTLIELLVVISIIGLLSSIVLSSLTTARQKARDAQRRALVKQIQNALELYRSDNGGNYPSSGASPGGPCSAMNNSWSTSIEPNCWSILQTSLAPYLPQLPVDPKQSGLVGTCGPNCANTYGFAYISAGNGGAGTWGCWAVKQYVIIFRLESGTGNTLVGCDGTSVINYGAGVATVGNVNPF